jgi:GNAT superfamily N-acetyltransferase
VSVAPKTCVVSIRPLGREQVVSRIDDFIAIAADVPGEYWTAQHFLAELAEKWSLSLAGWIGADLVGYAIVSQKAERLAHLHHFMVRADQRGTGLGSLLLQALEGRCRSHGHTQLSLKVSVANDQAVRFYERHGFVKSDLSGAFHVMQKALH